MLQSIRDFFFKSRNSLSTLGFSIEETDLHTANMPTPESELFKAQKPTVAPTFNGVDFDDTKAFKAAEDAIIREQWVGAMMTRLVGEELSKCYIKNGNNHLEKCGDLRGKLPTDARRVWHLSCETVLGN